MRLVLRTDWDYQFRAPKWMREAWEEGKFIFLEKEIESTEGQIKFIGKAVSLKPIKVVIDSRGYADKPGGMHFTTINIYDEDKLDEVVYVKEYTIEYYEYRGCAYSKKGEGKETSITKRELFAGKADFSLLKPFLVKTEEEKLSLKDSLRTDAKVIGKEGTYKITNIFHYYPARMDGHGRIKQEEGFHHNEYKYIPIGVESVSIQKDKTLLKRDSGGHSERVNGSWYVQYYHWCDETWQYNVKVSFNDNTSYEDSWEVTIHDND